MLAELLNNPKLALSAKERRLVKAVAKKAIERGSRALQVLDTLASYAFAFVLLALVLMKVAIAYRSMPKSQKTQKTQKGGEGEDEKQEAQGWLAKKRKGAD